MGLTQESYEQTMQLAEAVIDGELNLEQLNQTFAKKPFEYYLRRFVAEKTEHDIDEIGLNEIVSFIEENINLYHDEAKEILLGNTKIVNQQGNEVVFLDYRRKVRECLNFPKAERAYILRRKHPDRYNEYRELRRIREQELTVEQQNTFEELANMFDAPNERREMTRENLLKLFFYLNCSDSEAIKLLYRLGEVGFYFKSRYESMIWWALKENNNKFEKFLEMCNAGWLTAPQTAKSFGDEGTDTIKSGFEKCASDFDFEHKLLFLSPEDGSHKSIRDAYKNCIEKINERYNKIFNNNDDVIEEMRKKIENWKDDIYSDKFSKAIVAKKEKAIMEKEREIIRISERHHKDLKERNVTGDIMRKLDVFSIKNGYEATNIFGRANGIINDAIRDVRRLDIINAYFIFTVIEKYYDDQSKDLFDVIEFDRDDLLEIIDSFQFDLNNTLEALNFMDLNLGNSYEAYLVLCLATGNPLLHLCRSVSAFNHFEGN